MFMNTCLWIKRKIRDQDSNITSYYKQEGQGQVCRICKQCRFVDFMDTTYRNFENKVDSWIDEISGFKMVC